MTLWVSEFSSKKKDNFFYGTKRNGCSDTIFF